VATRLGRQPPWLFVSCLRDGSGESSWGCAATRLLVVRTVASVLAGMSAFITGPSFVSGGWV
jgi:hypothetical protein